ncbi:MAG TPA: P-loop NTPase [Oscillospiraceae bacterium]|nr:P-loop NTPase [Oscillospiraceae bacterium]HPS33651.1 P-loop NTPase [Oscillospiraceae bacterium]
MQKILTFCSGKGGVGKSTAAACVAASIVCRGKRVLLVDADQGIASLDILLGMEKPALFDICDAVAKRCDISDAVIPCSGLAGLCIASAALSPEKFCSGADITRFCRIMAGQFDFIIIDAPAGLGREFDSAVTAADEVVIVSTPDDPALRAATKTGALIAKMGKKSRLLLNKYDRRLVRKKIAPSIDDFVDAVGSQLLGVIPFDQEFAKLSRKGVLMLPKSAVSVQSFYNIAARICGKYIPLTRL